MTDLKKLLDEATDMARTPWRSEGSAIYSADNVKLADQLDPLEAALIVAAVNAVPELLARRREMDVIEGEVSLFEQAIKAGDPANELLMRLTWIREAIARAALNQEGGQ